MLSTCLNHCAGRQAQLFILPLQHAKHSIKHSKEFKITMVTPLYEKPSFTAFVAAFLRAFATKEDDPNIQGPDDLAYLFLDDNDRAIINDSEKRQQHRAENFNGRGYEYMIARTKLIDHLFQKALHLAFANFLRSFPKWAKVPRWNNH